MVSTYTTKKRGQLLSQPHFWKSVKMTFTFPKMGTWESSETPESLELDYRGQNTLPWGDIHIIGELLKCRYRKWPCMNHLDICNTKKGWESNWQFDSWPLKVGNRPDPGVCRSQHIIGKLSRRVTSLLQTSSQSEVWTKNYDLTKSWKSKPN